MAKVLVEVPDGRYCRGCNYLRRGTIECILFDKLCEEEESADGTVMLMVKHNRCPQGGEN